MIQDGFWGVKGAFLTLSSAENESEVSVTPFWMELGLVCDPLVWFLPRKTSFSLSDALFYEGL